MAKRPNIDPAVKEIILRMSTVDPSLTIQRISELVGVHPSSVHRVRKLYKETGKLVKTPERLGRKPALTDADIEVCALDPTSTCALLLMTHIIALLNCSVYRRG